DRTSYRERRHGARREVAVIDGSGSVVKHLGDGGAVPAMAAPTVQHVDHAARFLSALPGALREALHDAAGAQAVMLALAGRGDEALQAQIGAVGRNHMLTLAE